jgi:2-dehydro-3-deoxyphosphogluconate aldolase/(4S)-4-hydroxy-2-oxoglutarate aldolase
MSAWLERLRRDRVLVVIRSGDPEMAWHQAVWVIQQGGRWLELTATTPDYGSLIQGLRQAYPQIQIGCGTVTTLARAERALQAGSQFVVSPILNRQVMALAQEAGIPVVAGGLTPQEIWQSWQAGAQAVKVFPVASVGGSRYIQQVRGPFPEIPLIPTGGITPATLKDYWQAGAVAVALGTQLFDPNRDPEQLKDLFGNGM